MYKMHDKKLLYWLIDQYLSRKINTGKFRKEFHNCFVIELDRTTLTELEYEVFLEIDYIESRVSEFEEDHKKYPRVYYTEEDLKKKVEESKKLLNQSIDIQI